MRFTSPAEAGTSNCRRKPGTVSEPAVHRPIIITVLWLLLAAGCLLTGCEHPPAGDPATASSPPELVHRQYPLDPETPEKRRLAPGEIHDYPIHLQAGQFLHLTVHQLGIDVVATLYDPAGEEVLEADSPTADRAFEEVLAVTAVGGEHRLAVRPFDPHDHSVSPGDYAVELVELKEAGDEERRRASAFRLFAQAEELRQHGGPQARPQAKEYYHEALEIFREVGDEAREGSVLFSLGILYRQYLGDRVQAEPAYEKARSIFRRQGDLYRQAMVTHDLGKIAEHGEVDLALQNHRKALELYLELQLPTHASAAARSLAVVHGRRGEIQHALECFELAVEGWPELRGLEGTSAQARALYERGGFLESLGMTQEALDDLERARYIQSQHNVPRELARTLNRMGRVYEEQGEIEKALTYHTRALEYGREIGDRDREAVSLNDLAMLHDGRGDLEQAVDYYFQALTIFRELGNSFSQAISLHNLGTVRARQRRFVEAIELYHEAMVIFEQRSEPARKILTLLGIAGASRDLGNFDQAREDYRRVFDWIEDLRSKPIRHELRMSYAAALHDYYHGYIRLLMAMHKKDPGAGHDAEALAISEQARARSFIEGLAESNGELHAGSDPKLEAEAEDLERRIHAVDHRRRERIGLPPDDPRRLAVESQLRRLLREFDDVRAKLRAGNPGELDGAQPVPLTVAEIRDQVLEPGTVLLEYKLGPDESFAWLLGGGILKSFALPPRSEIEGRIRQAYDLLVRSKHRRSRAACRIALQELGDLLLKPVVDDLAGKRILVVGEGALQYLPFSVLPVPAARTGEAQGSEYVPLVAEHEIVHLPSASALAVLRERLEGRETAPEAVAVVADPVFRPHDPRLANPSREWHGDDGPGRFARPAARAGLERLVYAGQEADTILELVPPSTRLALRGFEARREEILSGKLSRYRILHFATHGILDDQHPELSRLALTQVDGKGEPLGDGFLYAHEIRDLELPADLVVLSACRTALGKEVRGEGLLGLTRAFMHAGAGQVVVSLWNVDDQATAELMARFYRYLLIDGLHPAAALRIAQEELRRSTSAPYFWAGFVLQGDWRWSISEDL